MISNNHMQRGGILRIAVGITMLTLLLVGGAGATKFINDNETGGDCTLIGSWNVATKTCTLTTDLTETIQIDSNGTTLDGSGHNMTGSNTGNGIYLSGKSGVTIKNLNVKQFSNGISLSSSSNTTLISNNANSNNGYGIFLYSSNNNLLSGNNANSNIGHGIYLISSSNNMLIGNNANSNTGYGIFLYSSNNNNVLSGNDASNNGYDGIYLSFYNNYNTLSDNNASNNGEHGIYLFFSSNNMLSSNNANSNIGTGIYMMSSSNNMLSGNDASNNNLGIYLVGSSYQTLINNIMTGNKYNFGIGESSDIISNQIDTSNLVDGKPVYYIKGASNIVYDSSTSIGTFYCINCINITIKNVDLNKNSFGIFFWNTSLSRILNVNVSNNAVGIYLSSSSNNTLSGNDASNNGNGIILYDYSNKYGISKFSKNNMLIGNNASNNGYNGISLNSYSNNTLSGNNASNNGYNGISLNYYSNNNTLSGNDASNNGYDGINLNSYSNNNTLSGNDASNNGYNGINLNYYSNNNTLSGNNANSNIWLGIQVRQSSSNKIYYNNFINNGINAESLFGTSNTWYTPQPITYTYNGSKYVNKLGNHWSDYTGSDLNGDGIGEVSYAIGSDRDYYPLMRPFEDNTQIPTDTHLTMNEIKSSTHSLFETVFSQNATLNVSITKDLKGNLNFTSFEVIFINSGSFTGKGFSIGNWTANIEGVSREGSWQGMLFKKPEERKIYLKGTVSGSLKGIVEGYLAESNNGSGIYDQYQATWTINQIGNEILFVVLDLNGTINYQESIEYTSELYVLQTSVQGDASGYYNGSLDIVLTHLRIDNETIPFHGQGFSIISYTSEYGSGEGWTHDEEISPRIVKLSGFFADPFKGIVSGVLDESVSPRVLTLTIERIDIGLPPKVDLRVNTWGPQRISPGQKFSYVLEINNIGLASSGEIFVRKDLSPFVKFIEDGHGVFYEPETHSVFWRVENLAPLSKIEFTTQVETVWGLSGGTIIKDPVCARSTTELKNTFYPGINWGPNELSSTQNQANSLDAQLRRSYYRTNLISGPLEVAAAREGLDLGNNYLNNPEGDGQYSVAIGHSGGTQTLLQKIQSRKVKADYVVFVAPAMISQEDIDALWMGGLVKKVIIVQSPDDILFSNGVQPILFQDSQYVSTITEDFPNLPPETVHSLLLEMVLQYYQNGYPPFDGSIEGLKKVECPEPQTAGFNSVIAQAHDPNIKYGPEGNVLPGQKLNYTVEFENEGEGIAFGVYFTDTLDEDIDDSALEIGPVISIKDGSVIATAGTYNPQTRTITWFVGEVGSKEGGFANLTANVRSNAEEGTEIINYATVYFPSVPEATRTNAIVSFVDITPPRYSNVNQNQSTVNVSETVEVSAFWQDGVGLNYTWLETNESGTWQNISYLKLSGSEAWSNFTIQPTKEGVQCWRIHANDIAGNENVTSLLCFDVLSSLDSIRPKTEISVIGTFGNNNWYISDVHLTLIASDEGGSGIDTTEYTTDGVNWIPYTGTPFTISAEATTTIFYRSTDKAGNVEDTKEQIFKIDTTPPLVTINVPAGEYSLNQNVIADWLAVDSISGIASATGTKPLGEAIDTSSTGTKIFEVSASDNAGNSVKKTVSYHVSYNFAGFFQPIDNLLAWNSAKAGSAVPVKFNLSGNQGLDIFAIGYPASQKINCTSNAPMEPVKKTVTPGSSNLSYNATIDQYNYVWKTDKTWAVSCRQLQVQLKDGTYHNASFKFSK